MLVMVVLYRSAAGQSPGADTSQTEHPPVVLNAGHCCLLNLLALLIVDDSGPASTFWFTVHCALFGREVRLLARTRRVSWPLRCWEVTRSHRDGLSAMSSLDTMKRHSTFPKKTNCSTFDNMSVWGVPANFDSPMLGVDDPSFTEVSRSGRSQQVDPCSLVQCRPSH